MFPSPPKPTLWPCVGVRGARGCCCWELPLLSPAATCRVLVGGTPGCPSRLGPARVIPWIRQSWAEPLVIPSGVGQGSAPPCLSVPRVTRGDSRVPAQGQSAGGAGHRDTPRTPQLRIHGWDRVGTTQGHLCQGKDHVGTAREPQGRGHVDSHVGTVCTHTDRHPYAPPGTVGGDKGAEAHGHPGSYTR